MVSPKCPAIQQFAYMKSRMGQSSSRICKTCINYNFAVFVGHEMTFVGYSLEINGIKFIVTLFDSPQNTNNDKTRQLHKSK